MGDVRVSQVAVESIGLPDPDVLVSQVAVESIATSPAQLQISQVVVETATVALGAVLEGSLNGSGAAVGALSTAIQLASAVSGSGSVAGSLLTLIELDGSLLGTATLSTPVLQLPIFLVGSLTGTAAATGSMSSSFAAALLLLF